MEKMLRSLAHQARSQRLDGPAHDETEFPLVGYCFENALVLCAVLRDEGFTDATVIVGTTERVADELIQAGYELASFSSVDDLGGLTHYWVEVDGYTVDISAESEANLGEIVVSADLPESYVMFDDSKQNGDQTYMNGLSSRCRYCGGQPSRCPH